MNAATRQVTWVLESDVFPNSHPPLRDAIAGADHIIVDWQDSWWDGGGPPDLGSGPVVFQGSLGNAARARQELDWSPGSYCTTPRFHCSAWYEQARRWLLHTTWRVLPAAELMANVDTHLHDIGCGDSVFVRPDSPLRPFSGRVLDRDKVSLAAIDHGFYFDDADLPVVIAPVRSVGREWRCVIVDGQVVAGSAYEADGRAALSDDVSGKPWKFAEVVAAALDPPDPVYVLDVCEADGDLRLLELNPFSGADLYGCSPTAIVEAVSNQALPGSP